MSGTKESSTRENDHLAAHELLSRVHYPPRVVVEYTEALLPRTKVVRMLCSEIERYGELYPEYKFLVFANDTQGVLKKFFEQSDVKLKQKVLAFLQVDEEGDYNATRIRTATKGKEKRKGSKKEAAKTAKAPKTTRFTQDVHTFTTFLGAALKAHELGVLDDVDSLINVAKATVKQTAQLFNRHALFFPRERRMAIWDNLERDLLALKAILKRRKESHPEEEAQKVAEVGKLLKTSAKALKWKAKQERNKEEEQEKEGIDEGGDAEEEGTGARMKVKALKHLRKDLKEDAINLHKGLREDAKNIRKDLRKDAKRLLGKTGLKTNKPTAVMSEGGPDSANQDEGSDSDESGFDDLEPKKQQVNALLSIVMKEQAFLLLSRDGLKLLKKFKEFKESNKRKEEAEGDDDQGSKLTTEEVTHMWKRHSDVRKTFNLLLEG